MKNKHYSRKQRQLRYLVKQLNNLLQRTDDNLKSEIKKMAAKIKYLVSKLNGIVNTNRMKRILGGIALLIGVSFTNTASAQWFAYPIQDPFNLQDGYDTEVNSVEFADIDNDGDYDFLSGEYNYSPIGYGNSLGFQFQENTGSVTNPNFSTPPTSNPYGLVSYSPSLPNVAIYQWFKMIDLDNDGDFDILSNVVHQNINQYSINTDFLYYENTGSATNPQFSTPETNPFGLNSSQSIQHTTLGDIDGDGDLDLLGFSIDYQSYTANAIFIENIGTALAPSFTTPQLNQFGMPSNVFSLITLEDIDTDGDLDIVFADEDYNYYMTTIAYVENTGTATAPQLIPPPTPNPFGLTFPQNWEGMAILNFMDLDGDGDNDLIAGTDDDMNLYFENVGMPQPATYECINYSCVDPGTGSGSYSTLLACQTNCTAPITYECDFPAGCYDPGNGSGFYTDLADCNLDCSYSTSVNENGIKNFKIYPNPVNSTLNISSDKKIKKIEIYDAIGRIIYAERNPSSEINVEQLESGLYSIAILFDDERIVKRFTK
jgi:hypothetical protein